MGDCVEETHFKALKLATFCVLTHYNNSLSAWRARVSLRVRFKKVWSLLTSVSTETKLEIIHLQRIATRGNDSGVWNPMPSSQCPITKRVLLRLNAVSFLLKTKHRPSVALNLCMRVDNAKQTPNDNVTCRSDYTRCLDR
jgi:hypothetical protein